MNEQEETIEAKWAGQLKRANRWHTREKIMLLGALKNRFGTQVVTVVDQVIAERALRYGSMIAQREGGSSIADFIRLLWEPERASGLEHTVEQRQMACEYTARGVPCMVWPVRSTAWSGCIT